MKSPRVIQLSRLKAPTIRKGRSYSVDFGIAKPLYKQLLSKLTNRTRTYAWCGKRLKLITWAFIAIYGAVGISFIPSKKITYADPILALQLPSTIPMLIMPAVTPIQPVQYVITPKTDNLANLYAWGNCTAYVASRLPVPSDWGNAIDWGINAQLQGYIVSTTPKVGAIAWSTTDSYLGHVALVEAVDGDQVTVSEMNYQGLGVVDSRVANPGEFQFIYL